MHHVKWSDGPFKTAILIKRAALNDRNMLKYYLDGKVPDDYIGFSLEYDGKKKPSAATARTYLDTLLPALDSLGITTLYCADGEYFKKLVKSTKAEPHLGYVMPCAIKDYEHMQVIYGVNYQSLMHDPKNEAKLRLSLDTLDAHLQGTYQVLGENIIHSATYPVGPQEIAAWLETLHQYPVLTADFEAFSLEFVNSGLGTVGFAWDKHNGGSFSCDYTSVSKLNKLSRLVGGEPVQVHEKTYGIYRINLAVRQLIKDFFVNYTGKIIWHNAGYDLKIAVYNLWMKDPLDYEGMLEGIAVMSRHFEDTKLITYLATNSCAGNKLSLKDQAHEYAGNYAQADINDITLIEEGELLKYNLVDCLSTWYVYEKHRPTMLADNQEDIYENLFLPAVKQILQMELVGMPIHMPSVIAANKRLNRLNDAYSQYLTAKLEAIGYMDLRRQEEVHLYNTTRVKARKDLSDFADLTFNPGSPKQLQHLLYETWNLPVLDYTTTRQPATGTKTLGKLAAHATTNDQKMVLRCLTHLSKVGKIISSFMPNFLSAVPVSDGSHRLYGGFNLGGTVSGRLSSSKPNLQQIPSGSTYAKLIKKCFRPPKGWLFVGADYNSLEDYVSALTTRDPNKIKVYTDGYDGHCLRAYYYFKEKFPNLAETPEDINKIKDESIYGNWRQLSKAPTFALTYQGTWSTLVNNCGFTPELAKSIEANYHKMYAVSDAWVADKLTQANKDGYVTVAYGLRVRTPLIAKVIWGGPNMPNEAAAEGRTAGNALGQAYGLVNTSAGVRLQERTLASEFKLDILPSAHIHDAQYFLVRDEVGVVKWLNDNLIECMSEHGLPELDWHPTVKIGAALDIFHPSWKDSITIENNSTMEEILCKTAKYR
jgi:DNA polymerase-1